MPSANGHSQESCHQTEPSPRGVPRPTRRWHRRADWLSGWRRLAAVEARPSVTMIEAQPADELDQAAALAAPWNRFAPQSRILFIARESNRSSTRAKTSTPPPALGVDRPHRRPRAQQDHRRPAAPGFPGRREAHPARDRLGPHPEEVSDCGREQSEADRRLGPAPGAHAHPPDQGVPSAGSMR